MSPVPLTVVGGFLGAGKTTLLNHLLRNAGGRRLAVLVNDFGAVNIDADLIASHDGTTATLSNGCICCSIGDSLVDALVRVTGSAQSPDHVVVEASGVADPGRVAELAYLDRTFALQGVVVVADSERVRGLAADPYVGDTVERQIRSADLLVVNKVDLVSDGALRDTEDWLSRQAPYARIVRATTSALPVEVVLGFDADHWGGFLQAPSPSPHEPASTFGSFVFEADRPFRAEALKAALAGLPSCVLRAKGRVATDDGGPPAVLQLVGSRWELTPGRGASGAPRTRLVVIGAGAAFDPDGLSERLAGALA